MAGRSLILVPGDQLTPELSSLKASDRNRDRILMIEAEAKAS